MNSNREMELYIHIPFCVKKCNYCDFLSAPADDKLKLDYINALIREIQFFGNKMKGVTLSSIYIGGGTPSFLPAEYIKEVMKEVRENFTFRKDIEISMECNPGTLTEQKLSIYKASGINRLSMGLQSTHNDELKELGRIHTYEDFLYNFDLARKCGFQNINVDLMSALPHQTTEDFLDSLKKIIRIQPEHISAYSLIIEEGTAFYAKYEKDVERRELGEETIELPNEDTEYEIYKATQKMLAEHGYEHYEISNYAKPGYACRHNVGYWRRTPYLGIGLGASSLLNSNVWEEIGVDETNYIEARFENTRNIAIYIENSRNINTVAYLHSDMQIVKRQSQMEEYMFLGLRMVDGITRKGFMEAFGTDIEGVYGHKLQKLQSEDLLDLSEGNIKLTSKGMDISNYVLSEFLLS